MNYKIIPTYSFTSMKKENYKEVICVHHYLNQLSNKTQPPGLADFLRGTIALWKKCNIHNVTLRINTDHPIFKWLDPCYHYTTEIYPPVREYLSTLIGYDSIPNLLDEAFASKQSFSVSTNAFYNDTNWGVIPDGAKSFIRTIMSSSSIKKYVNSIYSDLDIQEKGYKIIHLRFGDKYINTNLFHEDIANNIIQEIKSMEKSKYVLLSDSSTFAKYICSFIPSLIYWDNKKVHIGEVQLIGDGVDANVKDTLADFVIMSCSNFIYSLNDSGFSKSVSLIYDIPYSNLSTKFAY